MEKMFCALVYGIFDDQIRLFVSQSSFLLGILLDHAQISIRFFITVELKIPLILTESVSVRSVLGSVGKIQRRNVRLFK